MVFRPMELVEVHELTLEIPLDPCNAAVIKLTIVTVNETTGNPLMDLINDLVARDEQPTAGILVDFLMGLPSTFIASPDGDIHCPPNPFTSNSIFEGFHL